MSGARRRAALIDELLVRLRTAAPPRPGVFGRRGFTSIRQIADAAPAVPDLLAFGMRARGVLAVPPGSRSKSAWRGTQSWSACAGFPVGS